MVLNRNVTWSVCGVVWWMGWKGRVQPVGCSEVTEVTQVRKAKPPRTLVAECGEKVDSVTALRGLEQSLQKTCGLGGQVEQGREKL